MTTRVVNIGRGDAYDVYVGRKGKGHDGYFGNPHVVDSGCTCAWPVVIYHDRADAIATFRRDFAVRIEHDAEFRRRVEALRGLRLGCFCAPDACHADVYAEWLHRDDAVEDLATTLLENP